jgi:hypothetical protein
MTTPTETRDAPGAFGWITDILDAGGFPWIVVGGLAATVYGSPRALADIDIDTPRAALDYVAQRARACIIFGPARYRDEEFDIELLSLRWGAQDIDLTAAEDIRLFDRRAGEWRNVPTDLTAFETHLVLGRHAAVLPRIALIDYKRIIDRAVDRIDVEALEGATSKVTVKR